jgi:hypothetical protein
MILTLYVEENGALSDGGHFEDAPQRTEIVLTKRCH